MLEIDAWRHCRLCSKENLKCGDMQIIIGQNDINIHEMSHNCGYENYGKYLIIMLTAGLDRRSCFRVVIG